MKITKLLVLFALMVGFGTKPCKGMKNSGIKVSIELGQGEVGGILQTILSNAFPAITAYLFQSTPSPLTSNQAQQPQQNNNESFNKAMTELKGVVLFVGIIVVIAVIIVAMAIVLDAVGLFGVSLFFRWLKRRMEIPPLIDEKKTTLKSFSLMALPQRILAFVKKLFTVNIPADLNAWHRLLVYAPETIKELNSMVYRVALCKKLRQRLPVIGFFGAPGVGKTVFTQTVFGAENMLDMDIVPINGSDIRKNEIGEAIKQMQAAIDRAMLSPKRVAFIIDEAQHGIFTPGDRFADQFMSYFLGVLEDEKITKHIMFIYTTNNKSDISPAVLSRTPFQITIEEPKKIEMTKLLALYLNKYIVEPLKDDDVSLLNESGQVEQLVLKLEPQVMDKDFMSECADKLLAAGASGRAIDHICYYLRPDGFARPDKTVTREMIRASIDKYAKDKNYPSSAPVPVQA